MNQETMQTDNDLSTVNLEIEELRAQDDGIQCCCLIDFIGLGAVAAALAVSLVGVGLELVQWQHSLAAAIIGALLGWLWFALTQAQKDELKANAEKWKKDTAKCTSKTKGCKDAIDWVKKNAKFFPPNSGKDFATAMGVGGGKTIATAFRLEKLLGLLAQESSFGNNYGSSSTYKGAFQLSQEVIDDYNKHNDPDVTFPGDIDEAKDFDTAAKVAAWYLAFILQQLTFRDMQPPINDADEANKFALAAYNGGLGTIKKAQKKCKDAGKDSSQWDNVKDYLPDGANEADAEKKKKIKAKTKEIKEYVEKIREYEKLAKSLGCV